MQAKLLVCGLFMSLFIFNVLAQDVNGDGDNDDDLDDAQAKIVEAAETLIKNLKVRDATDLARRGWFSNLVNKYIKPYIPTVPPYIPTIVDKLKNVIQNGKRATGDNENLNVRDATNVVKRGWFTDLVNKYIKPIVPPIVPTIIDKIKEAIKKGKRTTGYTEVLNAKARDVSETECAKDAARFQEIKQASAKLCALSRIPNIKCH